MKIGKRFRTFCERVEQKPSGWTPKKRDYESLRNTVADLTEQLQPKSRSTGVIPYIDSPELPDWEHPCCYACYLAGVAWINCCLTIDEALETYNLYREAAEDCMAAHEV